MKLFFLIEYLNKAAGTERIATEVINGIYENTGWDITFVVLDNDINTFFPLMDGIKVISLEGKLSAPLKAAKKLRTIIKKEEPDYIVNVAVTMSRISIPAAILTNTKIVTWEHFNLFAGSGFGYYWRLLSGLLSYKTVVLTNRDRLSYPYLFRKKINTIYNFPAYMGGIRSELNSNIAISVGRLNNQKGFDILLKVWKMVVEKNDTWKLQIIGSGEECDRLYKQAKDLGIDENVMFVPATPEIAKYYEQASMYIMTSRFEGLPLVLIEAKQMGLPCVSFNCPNGPDEVIRNNVDGRIIHMGDERAMADSLLDLISDRNTIKEYGNRAAEDVNKRFSKQNIVKEWVTLLKK